MSDIERYIPTESERRELKVSPDEFKVSGDGAFFTIQGEGQSIGKPAVFLRLHLCNLECSWCDTKYTWDKNTPEFWKDSRNWSYDKTIEEITQYPTKRLVVTGGEPMLQQEKISKLTQQIPDWDIEIETNGTIPPNEALAERCQFNVSPKLDNSDNSLNKRFKPEVLRRFNSLQLTNFKFVVRDEKDLEEVSTIVEECGINPDKVIIMPEGTNQTDIKEHALSVVEGVKSRGWRMSPRFHVMLWGDKRGI